MRVTDNNAPGLVVSAEGVVVAEEAATYTVSLATALGGPGRWGVSSDSSPEGQVTSGTGADYGAVMAADVTVTDGDQLGLRVIAAETGLTVRRATAMYTVALKTEQSARSPCGYG